MENKKRLIDADELDKVLETFESKHAKAWFVITAEAISKARQIVSAMKAVDAVEVVHGSWIFNNHACGYYISGVTCNRCNKGSLSKENYCPNCGARMDGDENA